MLNNEQPICKASSPIYHVLKRDEGNLKLSLLLEFFTEKLDVVIVHVVVWQVLVGTERLNVDVLTALPENLIFKVSFHIVS